MFEWQRSNHQKIFPKKICGLKWHITLIDDRKTYQNRKGR